MSLSPTSIDQSSTNSGYVELDGETYYRIASCHDMPEFFMSLVGASDHWMFISSTGALTAGRCDPDNALFPYAADDQLSVAKSTTGSLTLIREDASSSCWEPFSDQRSTHEAIERNLYKTPFGNKLVFEEVNATRELVFRYRWAFSEKFGFVRTCRITNLADTRRRLELLDGIRNVLPYGVSSDFMMRFSNLANAYKKSELLEESQIGLFYLSSIPTDRAEPSEGLKTTTVWQTGLEPTAIVLSTKQLPAFEAGESLQKESVVRGAAGAYLVTHECEIAPGESIEWHVVAELGQDHCDVIELDHWLRCAPDPSAALGHDIDRCQDRLLEIVSSSDALQCGENESRANRHLSNTVFNVMRGGIPLEGYLVHAEDFRQHVQNFNRQLFQQQATWLDDLPDTLQASELCARAEAVGDADLNRLALEYLPLAFSRRHGDPTRPWNRFSIRLRSPNGKTNLDYQGNWRDIFQNWEALAVSFPKFCTAMICRFVNATTLDGYNPYRLTKGGFEWEEPTPDDPWANIGYWGDHQIIYLLRLLESNRRINPNKLDALLDSPIFVHANIPYRIKSYEQIKEDPQDTIVFDADLSKEIEHRVQQFGADGKLLRDQNGRIQRVTLLEKLLTLSLAKLSNFIPDGGIWLNTQRPEWNDANNALVGNGLSMVTACYLNRWFQFLQDWIRQQESESFQVSEEVAECFQDIATVLKRTDASSSSPCSPAQRRGIVDALSEAGSKFREQIYSGTSGRTGAVSRDDCWELFANAQKHLATTIRNNRRPDGLFHAYNLIEFDDEGVAVENLYEMLEGQVAVLSAGLLSATEVADLLDSLRNSNLYRENQNSYLLYPDRRLPGFLEKNQIDAGAVSKSSLLTQLISDANKDVIGRDVCGEYHFSGQFRNSDDLRLALQRLAPKYQEAVNREQSQLIQLFENVFDHRQFTGRSGTFFAYEGLGSIYWHMVSKLGLAVVENFFQAIDQGEPESTLERLRIHFQAIRSGIGAEKSPRQYGAFPSDPYSHTPENAGVKQPGMTGQVKEDVLSRFAEIGAHIEAGCLTFRFELFDASELLSESQAFRFFNLAGEIETIHVPRDAFAFTLCQVPIICHSSDVDRIEVVNAVGETQAIHGLKLDQQDSQELFSRSGNLKRIECYFRAS